MIEGALCVAVGWAAALFIWWRFIWSIKQQKTDFRGLISHRDQQPIGYWLGLVMLAIGASLVSFVAVGFSYEFVSDFRVS